MGDEPIESAGGDARASEPEPADAPCETNPSGPLTRPSRLWTLAAALLFGLALATPFQEVWRHDLSVFVPMFPRFDEATGGKPNFWKWIGETEQHFVAWQVSRNARVLIERPGNLFDTEQCHPTRRMMALGEPMIALGVVGIPAALLTRDPLLVYNFVLVAILFLAAFAMYLLVKDWTGLPAAGIVAALLYAFHPNPIADINHYYIHDTAWTVLALYFARRFMETGGLPQALLLALACAMQMAGSFYPVVGGALLGLPVSAWLFARYGRRSLQPLPVLLVLTIVMAAAWTIYAPYLEMRSGAHLVTRSELHFGVVADFLPGGGRFPGWLALALVACSLLGLRRGRLGASPQAALLAGSVIVLATAVSFSSAKEAPPLYRVLSSFVPGLDAVRRPNEILSAYHIAFTILAGLGCAWILRRVPERFGPAVAGALIALAFATTLQPTWLGLQPPVVYRALELRPEPDELDFFETLARQGNQGPLLEIPRGQFHVEADRLLLNGYHRRRTSACVNELWPDAAEIDRLIDALPERAALDRLQALGFTTLLVHQAAADPERRAALRELEASAARAGGGLRRLHRSRAATAYALTPPER